MGFGKLAADRPIVLRILRLALLFKGQGGELDGIEDVAEIQLSD